MDLELSSILFAPLIAAAVIILFFRTSKWGGAALSVSSAAYALGMALWLMLRDASCPVFQSTFELFKLGNFSLNFGYLFDPLSVNMIFVVLFVGFLIHVFSVGYMKKEESKGRYFAGLSFFMFSITGLALSPNLFMMFVFWELVGFSSYALIAHYASTDVAREASKKAFIVNRVGDFGFLLGIIFCWSALGTTNFVEIGHIMEADPAKASTAMGLLLMCGFLGKSAQFPLQVWLADAMAGPTPVSALIHAATMVAAGIFMMVRLVSVNMLTPEVLNVVLVICPLMAVCAGIWALGQNDIKKILAYSTLAHLGIMGAGIALGAELAMFHLTTHAFFKAALFLVAGSVICACHHEQDIFKMGGLLKKMPVTSMVAILATLSIMAFPMFAGYYSKEGILLAAFGRYQYTGGAIETLAFYCIFAASLLTPIYMGRLFFNVFLGRPHSEKAMHAKESSLWMVLPLAVLGLYSLAAGKCVASDFNWLGGRMDLIIPSAATQFISGVWDIQFPALLRVNHAHTVENAVKILAVVALVFAFIIYGGSRGYDIVQRRLPPLYNAMEKHGWFDKFYNWYVAKVQQRFAILLATFVDLFLIELLLVRGSGIFSAVVGQGFKRMHDISANSQIKWMAAGVILLFVLIYT